MKELPNFASATMAPHWQAANTTFPVRIQAKFDRRDKPGVIGSVTVSTDTWAAGSGAASTSGSPRATRGNSNGKISLVLTRDPDGNGRSRINRSAPDPNN